MTVLIFCSTIQFYFNLYSNYVNKIKPLPILWNQVNVDTAKPRKPFLFGGYYVNKIYKIRAQNLKNLFSQFKKEKKFITKLLPFLMLFHVFATASNLRLGVCRIPQMSCVSRNYMPMEKQF